MKTKNFPLKYQTNTSLRVYDYLKETGTTGATLKEIMIALGPAYKKRTVEEILRRMSVAVGCVGYKTYGIIGVYTKTDGKQKRYYTASIYNKNFSHNMPV